MTSGIKTVATKLTFLGRKVRQFEIQSKPGRYLFYRPPGTGACLGPAISAFEGLRGEKNVHIFFLIRKNWRYQHTPGLDHPETFRQNHMCCICAVYTGVFCGACIVTLFSF